MNLWFSICINRYQNKIDINVECMCIHIYIYIYIFPSSFHSQGLGSAMSISSYQILLSK